MTQNNMAKVTESRTKGESLTKKHDIWRKTGERRGTKAYELSFGIIKKETVRLSELNTRSYQASLKLSALGEGAKRATSSGQQTAPRFYRHSIQKDS